MKQVSDLIGYYNRVAVMPPEEQRREYASASQTLTRDPSPYNRIRAAIIASIPGTSFQDDGRALNLLAPYAKAGSSNDRLHQLGAILHQQVGERAKARAHAEQLKEQLEALRAVERTIKEQLDALRAVERTIIERGQPAPTPTPKR